MNKFQLTSKTEAVRIYDHGTHNPTCVHPVEIIVKGIQYISSKIKVDLRVIYNLVQLLHLIVLFCFCDDENK